MGAARRSGGGIASLRAVLGAGLLLGAAACGSGSTTVTVTAGSGTPTPTPAATGTATAPSASTATSSSSTSSASGTATGPVTGPTVTLVWAVTGSGGAIAIRTATAGGGATRTVASLPVDSTILAAGHGILVAHTGDGHIVTVDLDTGAQRSHASISGQVFGAAVDEAGQRVAFVEAASSTDEHLDVVDLGTDHLTRVTAVSNTFTVPQRWQGTTIAGPVIVGFADAGQQGARTVNSDTGARIAQTQVANGVAYTVFNDAADGMATSHSNLGDEGDVPGGPGPQGPFNTLSSFTIGGAAHQLLAEAHHNLSVLGGTPDGGTALIDDSGAAGGFAGITMSPDFGLFLLRGSTKTQLAHVNGNDRQSGVLLQDGSTAVVAEKSGGSMTLVQYAASTAPVTLDTVAGGVAGEVFLVAGP